MEYIYADSRTRDTVAYPNANTYTIYLTNIIKNISQVDLIEATVPNSMFNYTDSSSATFLTIGSSTSVKLYPGFYSASSLVTELSNNTAFTGAGLSITYNTADGKFIISGSTTSFTVTPGSQQAATILGLPNSQVTSALGSAGDYPSNSLYQTIQIVKSTLVADFTANDLVFLDIEELRTNNMHSTGQIVNTSLTDGSKVQLVSGTAPNRSFVCIPMDVVSGSIKVFKEAADYQVHVRYPQPVESLDRLTVRWRDVNGNLLNFNGANNNSFILRVHTLPSNITKERLESLPKPVDIMTPNTNVIVIVILVIGLLTIILMKKR